MALCSTHDHRYTNQGLFLLFPHSGVGVFISPSFPFLSFLLCYSGFRWDCLPGGCGYFTPRGEHTTPSHASPSSTPKSQFVRYFYLLSACLYSCFFPRLVHSTDVHTKRYNTVKWRVTECFSLSTFWWNRSSCSFCQYFCLGQIFINLVFVVYCWK